MLLSRATRYGALTMAGSSQVLRFVHWAPEKAEYRVSFRSGAAGDFACASASVTAPGAGAGGCPVEIDVRFEPTAVSEDVCDVLTLSSPVAGARLCDLRPFFVHASGDKL